MAKFEKQLFNQNIFFGMTLLHAHAQYIYIVNTKYQKASVKALVQFDFPVYAQTESQKQTGKKWLIPQSCYLSKEHFLASNFLMQMFNESTLCRQSIEF